MAASPPTFNCPACAKRYLWKPAFAGRTITCKCGHLFEPSLGNSPKPILAQVVEEPALLDEESGSRAAAPLPPPPPTDGRFLVPRARPHFEEEPEDGSPLKRFHVPITLIVLGVGLGFIYPLVLPPRR